MDEVENQNGPGNPEPNPEPATGGHTGVAPTRSEPPVQGDDPEWTKEIREQNRRIIELLEKNQQPENPEPADSDGPLVVETPPLPETKEAAKRKKAKSVPARRFGRGVKN